MRRIIVLILILVFIGCEDHSYRRVGDSDILIIQSATMMKPTASHPFRYRYVVNDKFESNYNFGFTLYSNQVFHVNDTLEIRLKN